MLGRVEIDLPLGTRTLGFFVDKDIGGGLITSRHCGFPSDYVGQNRLGAATVASIVQISSLGITNPACGAAPACEYADVALARPMSSWPAHPYVAQPSTIGSLTFTDSVLIMGIIAPSVGLPVDRIGKVTGWTSGEISAVCKHQSDSYNVVTLCAEEVLGMPGQKGDSGGPVFLGSWAAGILFGVKPLSGLVVFSDFDDIDRALGFTPIPY